jgi:hypothetical protein
MAPVLVSQDFRKERDSSLELLGTNSKNQVSSFKK